jgi:hypothetical protein
MSTRDPMRLVQDPSCPEIQRELLRHGVELAPPPGAEQRVWLGVVGAVGALGALGALGTIGGAAAAGAGGAAAEASTKTVTTAAKVNVAGLTSAKVVAIVAALAALGAFGAYLVGGLRGAPAPSASPPVAAPSEAPVTAPPATAPAAEAPPWETPPVREAPQAVPGPRHPTRVRPRTKADAPSPATAASPAARLGEETTLIRGARQALRGGEPARALQILEACRRRYPAGVLQQERERLTIEALVEDGRRAEASARAAQFLRKYPDSPHAGDVRALGRGGSGGPGR